MKILMVLFSRLGDVVCAIPSALELLRKYPDAKISWLTHERHFDLIPHGIARLKLETPGDFGRVPEFLAGFDQVLVLQPMWRHEEWKGAGRHVIDLVASWCSVTLGSRALPVAIPAEATRRMGRFTLPDRFVAIGSSPPASSRNVLDSLIPEILEFCRDRKIPYVTVGGQDGRVLEGAISLHGWLSPVETIALVERSTVYIGGDTGTTWLACAAKRSRKICVIDKERLSDGLVGFEKFIDSESPVHDVFAQDGAGAVCHILDVNW